MTETHNCSLWFLWRWQTVKYLSVEWRCRVAVVVVIFDKLFIITLKCPTIIHAVSKSNLIFASWTILLVPSLWAIGENLNVNIREIFLSQPSSIDRSARATLLLLLICGAQTSRRLIPYWKTKAGRKSKHQVQYLPCYKVLAIDNIWLIDWFNDWLLSIYKLATQ